MSSRRAAMHASELSACGSMVEEVHIKTEPSTLPESCEEKSSKHLLPTLDTKVEELGLSADQLKKHRRNERDRKRSFVKRETLERMRATVAVLELQKEQLLQHIAANSPCSPPAQSPSSWPGFVMLTSSPSPTSVTRDDYVKLTAEIEEFRQQNAAMVQELTRRDLFNDSLRYRLTSFAPVGNRSGTQSSQ